MDYFVIDGVIDIVEIKQVGFFCYLGMKYDLEQEVFEFVLQIGYVFVFNCISDFIGFFDCVWCYSVEILFDILGVIGFVVMQLCYDG